MPWPFGLFRDIRDSIRAPDFCLWVIAKVGSPEKGTSSLARVRTGLGLRCAHVLGTLSYHLRFIFAVLDGLGLSCHSGSHCCYDMLPPAALPCRLHYYSLILALTFLISVSTDDDWCKPFSEPDHHCAHIMA